MGRCKNRIWNCRDGKEAREGKRIGKKGREKRCTELNGKERKGIVWMGQIKEKLNCGGGKEAREGECKKEGKSKDVYGIKGKRK